MSAWNEDHDTRLPDTLLQRTVRFVGAENHPATFNREELLG